ncbi:MAG TPA: hypothetical protein VF303_03445 [Candidatus Nanoarchaeia archaeon]
MSKARRRGRNWRPPPPSGRSGRRARQRRRGVGNGGSANAVVEEPSSGGAASSQLPPKPPLSGQTLFLPESVMATDGTRAPWGFLSLVISSAVEKVRRALGWDFCEEELDEESKTEDNRVPRILARMDQILDLQEEAWREGELDRAELLQKAYGYLKDFLRRIDNAAM